MRQSAIGFVLAVLLSMFLVLAAQAQTDTSGSSSSTVPTLTIAVSSATATEGDEVTYTVTASSAPSAALPVVVHVRAHGEVMDTRTVAEVLLPSGATTVTLRLEEFTDEIDESPVNVTLTLAAGTGYSVGDPAEATVGIDYPSDSDTQATPTPTPTPAVSPPDAPSGVSISAPTINSFTVSWTAEAGKTYRVEREAAFLFSYGVWQTVANDLSSGSFTESGLPCDLFYVYQVRAKVAGSAYGEGKFVLGQAQSCTAGTSDGARAARSPSTPVRKLRLVTDRPTETSIRIRLLFHRNMDEGDLTHTPVYGMREYRVDRTRPGPPITGTPSAQDWINPVANPEYRMEHTVSEFDWTGLACGTHYWFRALGHGDGVEFEHDWGNVWSNAVHGSTRGCSRLAAPVVDVIPLPQRLAQLMWDEVLGADTYVVQAREKQSGDMGWVEVRSAGHGDWAKTTYVITLDRIVRSGGIVKGLDHDPYAYQFRVKAKDSSAALPDSDFSSVITIVDSPIKSVSGDADDTLVFSGRFKVKWNEAGAASDNVDYMLRWRVMRPYELASGALLRHDNLDWRPTEWQSKDGGTPYDWVSKETDGLEYTIDILSPDPFMLTIEEIYAFQLNYTIKGARYFSAREAYGWTSNRIGGDRGNKDKREVVGGMTLRIEEKQIKKKDNKITYSYRVCENTFGDPGTQAGRDRISEWKIHKNHAFKQWQYATDGLVQLDRESGSCTDYTVFVDHVVTSVKDKATDLQNLPEFMHLSDAERTALIKEHAKDLVSMLRMHGISGGSGMTLHSVIQEDKKRSEVLMIDNVGGPAQILTSQEVFPEVAGSLGYADCGQDRACAVVSRHKDSNEGMTYITTDIFLQKSVHDKALIDTSGSDRIYFNTCPNTTDKYNYPYSSLVHEVGHALGITGLPHPELPDSIMNHKNDEPDCSPHPLDIMAIFAIHQTK